MEGPMFKWMKRKAELAIVKSAKEDIDRFISMVRGISAEEVGLVVATATHYRNALAKEGIDLLHPMKAEELDPAIAVKIRRAITAAQKEDPAGATGWMVWLHTLRAANILEIRFEGRLLWSELSRGFPHVEHQANEFALFFLNHPLEIDGYGSIPQGLEPDERFSS
jgi:hypothetical protein